MAAEIWVVDDNPAVAESVVALLTVDHRKAIAMLSSKEVMSALEKSEPALMILDILMPGDAGNGNTVLANILAHPRYTFPVIVLCGDDDAIRKELRGRIFQIVKKSIDPIELLALVKRAIG